MTHEPEVRTRIDLVVPGRPLTLDDVALLTASDDIHRYELHEGNLVIMPPPDAEHVILTYLLGIWLGDQFARNRILPGAGVRVFEQITGRIPDIVVLRHPIDGGTVWVEPGDVEVAVEIVSPSSVTTDRVIKPQEYAEAGIPHYWRVERTIDPVTVHRYTLGADADGKPCYHPHDEVPFDKLITADTLHG